MNKPFTKQDAIKIQQLQLARWKDKLRPEIYNDLAAYLEEENNKLPDDASGHDVERGSDLDAFIANWTPSPKTIIFNTGRQYTEHGQRIAAREVMGGVYMVDVDRGLDYWYKDIACTRASVMHAYDNNKQAFDAKVSRYIYDSNLRQELTNLAKNQ